MDWVNDIFKRIEQLEKSAQALQENFSLARIEFHHVVLQCLFYNSGLVLSQEMKSIVITIIYSLFNDDRINISVRALVPENEIKKESAPTGKYPDNL